MWTPDYAPVEEALATASGIGFDGCHKIYVLMDDNQMDLMRKYGYDKLISATDSTPAQMLATVAEWYDQSCGLRFVESVATMPEGRENEGFEALIPQGAEDYATCDDCLERLTQCVCDDDEDYWDNKDEEDEE